MAVTSSIVSQLRVFETGSGDLATPRADHFLEFAKDLASGTTSGSCDRVFSDTRTLTATSESLDLSGSLTSLIGAALSYVTVHLIAIQNTHAMAALTIGNAASPAYANLFGAATHTLVVPPGGFFLWVAPLASASGLTVTNSSADLLKIDAGAATITYKILILGRSA